MVMDETIFFIETRRRVLSADAAAGMRFRMICCLIRDHHVWRAAAAVAGLGWSTGGRLISYWTGSLLLIPTGADWRLLAERAIGEGIDRKLFKSRTRSRLFIQNSEILLRLVTTWIVR